MANLAGQIGWWSPCVPDLWSEFITQFGLEDLVVFVALNTSLKALNLSPP